MGFRFDIGGSAREKEEEHWGKTDTGFWNGKHRNDSRINRSNILWPFTPNVCDQDNRDASNDVHTLRVKATEQQSSEAGAPDGNALLAAAFSLHVLCGSSAWH